MLGAPAGGARRWHYINACLLFNAACFTPRRCRQVYGVISVQALRRLSTRRNSVSCYPCGKLSPSRFELMQALSAATSQCVC